MTTTTTVAPTTTTTVKPGEQFTIDTCKKLDTLGYETRKRLIASVEADFLAAGGTGSGTELLTATCPQSVERMAKAKTLEERRLDLTSTKDISLRDGHCSEGYFDVTIINNEPVPAGIVLMVRITVNGKTIETIDEPIVVWSLQPGGSRLVDGTWVVTPETTGVTCEMAGTVFLADDSPTDAALPTSTNTLLQSPDPAVFLPELIRLEVAARAIDDPAVTEDLRSSSYDRLVKETSEPVGTSALVSVVVCPGTTRQPSLDLMSFIYFSTYGPRTETIDGQEVKLASSQRLAFGVFRRGSDGQWRWLGTTTRFDSTKYHRCGVPGQTLAEG